ncbi:MAG: hypothetical protein DSZ30_06070 [Aquificaceae bacterium]|nr:MAG: hypothetical protein DSZ30_06070 [Aquificaceae bacterium]
MAKIFIPQDFTPERGRYFEAESLALNKLKKAFEKDRDVVIYFHPVIYIPKFGREIAPDIIWFKNNVGAVIIEVKAWGYNFLKDCKVVKGRLKHLKSGKSYTNPVYEVRKFLEGLMDLGGKPVGWVFFLPNLSYKDYDKLGEDIKRFIPKERTIFQEDYSEITSKEIIREKIFGTLASFYTKIPQNVIEESLKKLKKILFPYLEIPQSDNILDEVQEQILYNLREGHKIIRGGPGSGKTVTLLGKAIHEALKAYLSGKEVSILFLTYTNALVSKIKKDLEDIVRKRELPKEILKFIEVRTLHSYAGSILRKIEPRIKIRRDEDLVEKLLEILKEKDIPAEFKVDFLLVDESQDLKLSWFKLLHKIKKENSVVAFGVDETQRIYEDTNWKWKDTGFEARGNVIVLKKIYRSAGKILDLAVEFLKRDPQLVKQLRELENYWLDEVEKFDSLEGKVEIKVAEKYYNETVKVLESLLYRYKPGEILILTPGNWSNFYKFLSERFEGLVHFPNLTKEKELHPSKVNITTYYSSKGLEAKVAIVVGFERLFETENKKAENLRRLRRLGFVALTRAQKELYVIGGKNHGALRELIEIINRA